jgi:hypothetical protein
VDGSCEHCNEQLAASQEGLSSIKLAIINAVKCVLTFGISLTYKACSADVMSAL